MKRTAYIMVLTAALLAASCAKQGYPSGGPRDTKPPTVVGMNPASGSLNFGASSFSVAFDEYVVLKDASNNILVSPPIEPKPQYTIKGKSLVVKLPDSLQSNTTYLFQMLGAVADFTEGNAVESFEYSFSTGDHIDSLTLDGRVLSAATNKAHDKTVSVMLYRDGESWSDSAVVNEAPAYVTRCTSDGTFRFSHIAPGGYHLFAIEDANHNNRYDNGEAFAFDDSVHVVAAVPQSGDSLQRAADSLRRSVVMLLSAGVEKARQRVSGSKMTERGHAEIITAAPMTAPTVTCDDSIAWRIGATGDTLHVWSLPSAKDTLVIRLSDASGIDDTLVLRWKGRRQEKEGGQKEHLKMKVLFDKEVGLHDTLRYRFERPVTVCDEKGVKVIDLADSSATEGRIVTDSLRMNAWLDIKLKAEHNYSISFAPKALVDIWGCSNDTTAKSISTLGDDKFGSIYVTLPDERSSDMVVQLTDEQGKVLMSRRKGIGESRVAFLFIAPMKYRLQAFHDTDGDGKLSIGDYFAHRQPERLHLYEKTLELRANWDIEETWHLTP